MRYQQVGKLKCRHAARVGQGGVSISRTTAQQLLLEMQKSRAAAASQILLTEVNHSRSLKSSSGRELQGCSPQQGAVAWMQHLPSLSTGESLNTPPADLQEFLLLFTCRRTSPEGSTGAVLTLIIQRLVTFNNNVSIRLHFNLAM